ncbi:MAG: ATP-grasp domain-containing protein [Clostridia bacterium]|nr:ATP-grasp domain-containing protein [Clostridia bacterium]
MRKIAVFFGGKSCENEISILTGLFVMNVLDRTKYEIFPVYIDTDGKTYTSPSMTNIDAFRDKDCSRFERIFFEQGGMYAFNEKKKRIKRIAKPDCALNCCHGGLGEGGGVSALAAWNNIPLASPDLTSSGVFMDKCATKLFLRALNVPIVDYIRVNEADYQKRGAFLLKSIESRLKYPVVVKPAHLGSSIGIATAENEEEAKRAIEQAFALDDRVIVEKFLRDKKDVNCAAYSIDGEIYVSEAEESFGAGLYTFEEKYVNRDRETPLSPKTGGIKPLVGELRDKIRAYTKTVYKRMDLKGVVRMDFLVSDGKAYLCEVNAVPGSLAYYLFCERISDARTFFGDLIEDAINRGAAADKSVPTTGILHTVRWRRK